MSRWIGVGLVVAAVVGGAYLALNYRVEVHRGQEGELRYVMIVPRQDGATPLPADQPADLPPSAVRPAIRIATLSLGRLSHSSLADPRVGDVLLSIITRFDVLAVQDVRAKNKGVLVQLVEQINADGRHYDFAVSPRVEQDAATQYSAFLFDKATTQIDRSTVQLVEDPAARFRHRPLVALFRVRGPAAAESFTFKLINVHTDPDRAAVELDLLDDVYRVVRDDGSREDDVILLGQLGTGDERWGQLGQVLDLTGAISGIPTTLRGTRPLDNILFDRRATVEFTGRAEVLDVMREYDLTLRGASRVLDHLPVWAEFSSYEGNRPGHIASRSRPTAR